MILIGSAEKMISLDALPIDQVQVILEQLDHRFDCDAIAARVLAVELGEESEPYLKAKTKCETTFLVLTAVRKRWQYLAQLEEVRRRSGVAA